MLHVRCTYYEAEYAKNKGKKIILLRMIPFEQEFDHLQARVLFGMNNLTLTWQEEMPMPDSLPEQIVEALKENRQAPPSSPTPALSAFAAPIVVSCPEVGTLQSDGSEPYDEKVMEKMSELQKAGRVKMAFDRAGTSNASKEDTTAFEACTTLREAGNPMWKDMVKGTNWFQTCESKRRLSSSSFCVSPLISRPVCRRQIAAA